MTRWVSLGAGVVTALLSLLLVVPAPTKSLALLAVALGEKSFLLVALSAGALLAAWRSTPPGDGLTRWLAVAVTIPTVALAAWPVISALRLARARNVDLDLGRYLAAPIDTGAASPDGTVSYATVEGGARLELDFYRPQGSSGQPAPAIVVLHGGGWSKGDKGETARSNRWLASRGFAVFDVQYRLGPQPNWRTATGDVKCAVAWVKERSLGATKVLVDPERVALLGRSAGGHLALLAAYSAAGGETDLPASCPAGDSTVSAVVALYAPTDLVWGYGLPANPRVYDTSQKLRDFLGGTPSTAPEAYRAAGIVNRVTPAAPRTLFIHGLKDQFVSPLHIERLRPFLDKARVPYDVLLVPYGQHGFDHVFGGLSGQIVETTLLRFLQQGMEMMARR